MNTFDEFNGQVNTYLSEGEMANDPLKTFVGYRVVKIPGLQKLLDYICKNGFEHHTTLNLSQCTAALIESFTKYLG